MNCIRWIACAGLACTGLGADAPVVPDGKYSLRITHQARLRNDEDALKPIPAAQYEPARGQTNIAVQISGQGRQVLLLPGKISGTLHGTTNSTSHFELKEGLFAGGSFAIGKTESGWVGTYTVFGSGRPIVSSVRGPLVLQP